MWQSSSGPVHKGNLLGCRHGMVVKTRAGTAVQASVCWGHSYYISSTFLTFLQLVRDSSFLGMYVLCCNIGLIQIRSTYSGPIYLLIIYFSVSVGSEVHVNLLKIFILCVVDKKVA